ncbi:enoyl-CoA hydratase/isomerase family protein [Xinfangfangia sp. CPCC 101601]|uniref:Enoyl-CoA hydratase/isomerase family protein n=1 Tax=Pseudogemmobacter lacusdianii TaxID=3069608 RepID=A0ABU0W154_9RHOB|nr:enoyl-CoA hydratase/isomerase family protein [Xinfangfangia sp. CPCC 101601]MDQ2067741.1 enoyl-CoA hydratase/isomerase family protein [Xinfangfangia sp. CPCC 101601]
MMPAPFDRLTDITVETRGAARLVTLNRPTKANALTKAMLADLQAVISATAEDESIRLFALTGAGERIFCAGADLSEAGNETGSAAQARAYDAQWDGLTASIARLPCVTLALLNGGCIGGGMSVALAFDLRYAQAQGYFSYPAARHGFMPSPMDVERLTKAGGQSTARRIFLACEKLPVPEALRAGLVDGLMQEAEPWAAMADLMARLETAHPISLLAAKRLIDRDAEAARLEDLCYRAVYDKDPSAAALLQTGP